VLKLKIEMRKSGINPILTCHLLGTLGHLDYLKLGHKIMYGKTMVKFSSLKV
jgi:hypothetical protein